MDWSDLCNETPAGYEDVVTVGGCDITIVASPALAANLCEPCAAQPPSCCDKSLWFCINNDSRELDVDGGDETWDVTDCCPDCTSATVRLRMTCSNGVISLQRTFTCDGVVSNQTINISSYCSSTATTTLNIPTPNCFLQAQISIAELACDACDPCVADPDSCVVNTCCGVPVPKTLSMTIVGGAYAGTYGMTYAAGEWVNDTGAFSARMSCDPGGWIMNFELDTYTGTGCPPITFDVSTSAYGITSLVVS